MKQGWTIEKIIAMDGIKEVSGFTISKVGGGKGGLIRSPCFCNGQLLAPFTVEGSCNRTVFETWLEACLIPTLKPGQILIVDNATFHKGGNIIQLIEAAGCQLKYLPSYSPDLNKIERCWSWLKSRIRKQLTQYGCLRDAMEAVLRTAA
jgi:transposase